MIHELKIMRGPNIWSHEHHNLIVVKLKPVEDSEKTLAVLVSHLTKLFPEQANTINKFVMTNHNFPASQLIARLFAYVAVLMQFDLKDNYFYDSRLMGTESFFAVFEYETENVGINSARITSSVFTNLLTTNNYSLLKEDLAYLKSLHETEGPSTLEIINEAKRRNIPVKKIAKNKYYQLGHGKLRKRIQAAITEETSYIGVDIAGNKQVTKELLHTAMIPVPQGVVISDESELEAAVAALGYPLVTKPLNGHQGKNITTDITKFETLKEGFRHAKEYSSRVIIEKFISGKDYRFLVVNGKLVAAAERSPAFVTGDGKSTIQQLIDEENSNPLRANGHSSMLTKIEVDSITESLLKIQNLTLNSVLEEGKILILKDTANLSTGGTAIDVTDEVHPENIRFAERVARLVGLDICGIDILAPDVQTPLTDNGGAVIEVNAAPGLRMHVSPTKGIPRKVGKAIIDMMFGDTEGRIPLIAITGTNGKTTTSRLMAHVVHQQGFCTGFTTTEGIYINGEIIVKGDCSGPKSTAVILDDPSVEFAVLECARGGILRSGLAFDQCDIGIVTNVAEDHIGLNDIYSVEDLAKVKAVVPRSVKNSGYAILNASVELVYHMKEELNCKVALFSTDPENKYIREHCKSGGIAAVKEQDGTIVILDGQQRIEIDNAANIPITMNGRAGFMIENIMPVVLSAYVMKFDMDKVKESLRTFFPNEEQAPGRMNLIEVANVHVMVDYAHNPHSLKAFSELMRNISERKTGIITGVGDRRDEDIRQVGALCASMYDDVIIRIDKDTRGRDPEEIVRLIKEGIRSEKENMAVQVIPEMKEALLYAIHHAEPGSYIILNAENVQKTLSLVKEIKQEYEVNA